MQGLQGISRNAKMSTPSTSLPLSESATSVAESSDADRILSVVLEEYRTLRSEVINAVDRQYSLTNWSISGVALLVVGLVTGWHNLYKFPNIAVAVVLLALPSIATLYAIAWSHVISKISLLGWQLHHTENKVALLFPVDQIRRAYNLRFDEPVEACHYLIGWEHRLWRNKAQPLIKRTVRLVVVALALGYVVIIGAGIYVGAITNEISPSEMAIRPGVIAIATFWLVVWCALAKYLNGITAVEDQRPLQSLAGQR
jgi:hypothetical protein